jgi:FAD:protein FMN transferase
LLHGGTSSVQALGHPPDAEAWKVAIDPPKPGPGGWTVTPPGKDRSPFPDLLATVPLCDEAMSVSAVWGKFFQAEGRTYGHVLDPRTGQPARGTALAAVALPSATETDALSTALLTLGPAGHDTIANLRPGMRTLLVAESAAGFHVEARGIVFASI